MLGLMIYFVKNKTVYSVMYIISGLLIEYTGCVVFTRMMMSVPPVLSTYVSTLPTTSRTISSSFALCLVSCITNLVEFDVA